MTRVLQVMAGAAEGGAELYFVRLACALARAGVVQRAVIRPHGDRVRALEAAGIPVVPAPFSGLFDVATRKLVRREIAAFHPQVVMSYMTRATRFVPRNGFVHIARLGGYYDLHHYRQCDHLVGNTPDLVEYFIRGGWPPDRAHYIPNFVEDRKAAPLPRETLATPAGAPLVFALGRFHRNKAFDVLLEALARLPEAYLWLAGEGPEREALEGLAARLGIASRVRFLGWRQDPGPCYAAADVFVLPSRHEPLGNVLIEAWMHGLPAVAAASQGPRFLIEPGVSGLLVPVDDPAALARGIGEVIADPALAARLGQAGRAAFEANFTEQVSVARHLALFERVLG